MKTDKVRFSNKDRFAGYDLRIIRVKKSIVVFFVFVIGGFAVCLEPLELRAGDPAINGQQESRKELTLRERLEGFSVGAHRGGYYGTWNASNTLESFEVSRKTGARIIETDLRLTKDGVLILFHDKNPDKKTSCSGRGGIVNYTFGELRDCHYNLYRNRIDTFDDALKWSKGRIVINAEFKSDDSIEPAIKLVRKHNAYKWVYFQTQDDREKLRQARDLDLHVNLLFAPENREDLIWALNLNDPNLVVIEFHHNIRTKELIQMVHDAGKLASINSWYAPATYFKEYFTAQCDWVFEQGIDIAITNNVESCLRD